MNGSTFKVGHTFPPQQTVSGAASNGSGLIRLTVGSTVGMQTGDPSFVSQVGGTVEANGIWTITVIDATHIDLQGTTFTHAYTSGGLFVDDQAIWLFHTVNTSQVKVYDLAFTQTTPIAIPISGPQGTIGLLADTGGSNYLVVNSSCSGGQAPFGISGGGIATGASPRTHDVTVLNQTSTGCVYGFFAADNGDGVTVRGLYTDVVDRSYFVYGVKNHDVQLVSRNGEANDVLIKAAQAGNGDPLPTRNIKLQYEIRKRTDGLFPATYVDIDLSGGNPGYIGDIQLDISGDLSGENTATKPLVQIEKHTTGTLGATVENVKIGCTVTGIQNLSGILIDLFDAADAPWTGEFARNVMVEGCTGTGSATPTYHSDLAAFTNAGSGAREEWKSVNLPGTRSYDNPTVFNRWDTQVSLAGVFTSSSCNQIGGSDLPAAVQALQPINSTNYHGGAGYTASAAPSNGITLPRAGFFNTLFVTTDSNPAGTDTETLFGGAGAQPNTCNITTGNTQCSDMTHVSQEFSPGALIYERAVTANSGSPRGISWSGQFCSP
jgi:hypothetical protein